MTRTVEDINARLKLVEAWQPTVDAKVAQLRADVDALRVDLSSLSAHVMVIEDTDLPAITAQLAALGTSIDALNDSAASQAGAISSILDRLDALEAPGDPPPPPPPQKTLWGANTGGYRVTLGESAPDAYARIKAGFGRLNVIRWWVNGIPNWANYPTYFDKGVAVAPEVNGNIATFLSGVWDTQIIDFCKAATVPVFLVGWHEPEKDVFTAGAYTMAQWQQAQVRLAFLVFEAGNSLVQVGPVLMGGSYNPARYTKMTPNGQNRPASEWLNYDMTDVDFIGGDFYQWGSSDAGADPTSRVLDPAVQMAKDKGVQLAVMELGAVARSLISDDARRAWYQGMADIVAANPGLFNCICTFESDNPPNGPYCLLPPAGKALDDPAYSPKAAALYRSLCMAP